MPEKRNQNAKQARIIIAGGGTGGHAIPALCVAESLRERGAAVEFIGAESGIEATLVPDADFKLHPLPLAGFAGSVDDRVRAGLLFARAVISCRRILKNFRPNAVFGVGGYASAPAVIAANTLKIPTFLHEQNSVPGRVNRFAARFTKEVFATFPEAAEHFGGAKTVGMPTRRECFGTTKDDALSELGLRPPVAFIFGGSGGALKINLAAMEAFREETAYTVIQIAGRRDFSRLSTDNPRHRILEYADDVWKYIAASDVVVSRAGAGSLFDVAAAGRAAVFIPYPHATGDHQTHNARYFTDKDAAILLPDSEVTPESIKSSIENLLEDEKRREGLAERIRELATPNAADEVAERLLAAGGEGDGMRGEGAVASSAGSPVTGSSEEMRDGAGDAKNEAASEGGAESPRGSGAGGEDRIGAKRDERAAGEGSNHGGSKDEKARDENTRDGDSQIENDSKRGESKSENDSKREGAEVEAAKHESSKGEDAKNEGMRDESTRGGGARSENDATRGEPRSEDAKAEEAHGEGVKRESTKDGASQSGEAKAEGMKAENPQIENDAKRGEPRIEDARIEETKSEEAHDEGTNRESAKNEHMRRDDEYKEGGA